MKQLILKILYCVIILSSIQINISAQEVKIPDPFASLSKEDLENMKKEYGSAAIKAARSEEIAHLMLNPYTSIEMGRHKAKYYKETKALKIAGKTGTDFNIERDKLRKEYYSQVRYLLNDDKYAQWRHYIEYRAERKYMREYGFSAEQIASYSHEAFKTTLREEVKNLELSPEIAIIMGEMIVSYKSERNRIKNSGLASESIKSALKFQSEVHEKNVRILIGEDKFHIWKRYIDDAPRRSYANKHGIPIEQIAQYSIDAIKTTNSKEITHLSLSPIDALKMGEIKAAYKKSVQEVSKEDPEYKSKHRALKEHYHSSVRQLLGAEKFMQWIEYLNRALERKYTEKYGFTMEQFKKYQDLENRLAVTTLRIKSSAIPKEDKLRKIQEAKEEKITSLRQYLPAEVFDKWYKAYLENEEKKKTAKL